jgi:hypothetical protein
MGENLGEVVQYTSYQDLAIGRTDFVINALINLNTIAKEKPDVFAVGEAVAAPADAAWPVKKGNAELLALINQFLTQERGNGELFALQNKWLGVEMPDMPTSFTAEYGPSARGRAGHMSILDFLAILHGAVATVALSLSGIALGVPRAGAGPLDPHAGDSAGRCGLPQHYARDAGGDLGAADLLRAAQSGD